MCSGGIGVIVPVPVVLFAIPRIFCCCCCFLRSGKEIRSGTHFAHQCGGGRGSRDRIFCIRTVPRVAHVEVGARVTRPFDNSSSMVVAVALVRRTFHVLRPTRDGSGRRRKRHTIWCIIVFVVVVIGVVPIFNSIQKP